MTKNSKITGTALFKQKYLKQLSVTHCQRAIVLQQKGFLTN